VPINTAAMGPQIGYLLKDSGARLLAIEGGFVERLANAGLGETAVETIWVVDESAAGEEKAHAMRFEGVACGAWPPLPAQGATADPVPASEPPILPSDILAILYTSGTTGPAKGVLCPHAQYHWWGVHSAEILGVGAGDVLCTTLPLFHINALNTFAQASLAGARVVFEPRFSASAFWATMRLAQATVVYLLGAMVPILLAQPLRRQSANTACASVSARACRRAPRGVSRAQRRAAARRLRLDRDQLRHRQRAGPLAPRLHGVAAAGLRGLGRRCSRRGAAAGRSGRAAAARRRAVRLRQRLLRQARGDRRRMAQPLVPHRRPGWCARPTAPSASSTASRTRSAGAARTSRRTRSSRCCRGHPAVAAVAVYPVRSELAEDEVMAAVVAREGGAIDPAELVAFCRTRLPYFAIPRYVELVADLPRTENGKVQKFRLRERGVTPPRGTGRPGPREVADDGRVLERRARDQALERARALAGGAGDGHAAGPAPPLAPVRAASTAAWPEDLAVRSAADLAALPFTLKDDLRAAQDAASDDQPFGENQAAAQADIVQAISSSGTTGRPLYYALTARDVETIGDAIANVWFTAGIRSDDVVAHLVGLPMVAGGCLMPTAFAASARPCAGSAAFRPSGSCARCATCASPPCWRRPRSRSISPSSGMRSAARPASPRASPR
jgi:crotonobetaine/carnitine-CoA ligase